VTGRVLVTGAGGFIGRRCLPRLVDAGFEMHAVSSRPQLSGAVNGRWHHFDLLDAAQCRRAVETIRPTHLLHLAWVTAPGAFWTSPDNHGWLVSSRALFEAFYDSGGKRVLGVGTCAEYGWQAERTYAEDTARLEPDTLYGQCKAAAWVACEAAATPFDGEAAWARLFYPYGPGEPESRLLSSVIVSLLQGRTADCTAGTQVRDFIYVDDVADALVALLASSTRGAFNVGTGQSTPLREAVELVANQIGRRELLNLGGLPARPGDAASVVADMRKLTATLRWRPRVSLREGIEATIAAWRAELSRRA
jgi:nucleoside-diphosphate-sugar epimerase